MRTGRAMRRATRSGEEEVEDEDEAGAVDDGRQRRGCERGDDPIMTEATLEDLRLNVRAEHRTTASANGEAHFWAECPALWKHRDTMMEELEGLYSGFGGRCSLLPSFEERARALVCTVRRFYGRGKIDMGIVFSLAVHGVVGHFN
jgi:hypothetical protein